MKERGLQKTQITEEVIGLIDKLNTQIDKLNSIVNALKSIDTDKFNVNHKTSEIMVPVDIQAESIILIDETIDSGNVGFINSGTTYMRKSETVDGTLWNEGTLRIWSYCDGKGVYDGNGVYD